MIIPRPPASTTPAFLRTGSISGVCFKISSPVSRTFFKNTSKSSHFFATLTAFSAITRITVKIVPSFGFVTALYAIFAPSCIAFANTFVVISLTFAVSEQKPLKIWEVITPLFPLAPFNAPFEKALLKASRLFVIHCDTSFTADFIVKNIFVPVSPSGTGNTLSESTYFLFCSRRLAPATIIFRNVAPFIVFIIILKFS